MVNRLREEGHLVGPHSDEHLLYASWDRPPRLLVTRGQFEADLAANLRRLEPFGIKPDSVRVFLPPYEHFTEEIAAWTREGGRALINMTPGTRSNTDYMVDTDPRFVPAARIVASILSAERADPDGLNGYLLLMHLGAGPKRTRDHLHTELGKLLDELSRRGYRLVRVDDFIEIGVSMGPTYSVHGIQMEPRLGRWARTSSGSSKGSSQAADAGAQLAVFPECALSGYGFATREEGWPMRCGSTARRSRRWPTSPAGRAAAASSGCWRGTAQAVQRVRPGRARGDRGDLSEGAPALPRDRHVRGPRRPSVRGARPRGTAGRGAHLLRRLVSRDRSRADVARGRPDRPADQLAHILRVRGASI